MIEVEIYLLLMCARVCVCVHVRAVLSDSIRPRSAREEVRIELALGNFHVFIKRLFPCIYFSRLKKILTRELIVPWRYACQLFN